MVRGRYNVRLNCAGHVSRNCLAAHFGSYVQHYNSIILILHCNRIVACLVIKTYGYRIIISKKCSYTCIILSMYIMLWFICTHAQIQLYILFHVVLFGRFFIDCDLFWSLSVTIKSNVLVTL